MSIISWAENEIKLAKEFERKDGNSDECEFDYGCACYDSALKAFKCLCEDGHSGTSIKFTQEILNKLIDIKPLRPIVDSDFDNAEFLTEFDPHKYIKDGIVSEKQCPRMSSLFRTEYDDGTIIYNDIDRSVGHNINTTYTYYGGYISRIIDEMFPIKMPYTPYDKPFVVETDDFCMTGERGCYDHKAYFYVMTPWGEKIDINKFEKETEDGWVEISKDEYEHDKKCALLQSENNN